MADRSVLNTTGYGRSTIEQITIAAGETTADPVDLGRNYAFIAIRCANLDPIQANTTIALYVGYDTDDDDDALYRLGNLNYDGGDWATDNLPTTERTLAFGVPAAAFAQKVKIVLNNAPSGAPVVFEIIGFDPSVNRE